MNQLPEEGRSEKCKLDVLDLLINTLMNHEENIEKLLDFLSITLYNTNQVLKKIEAMNMPQILERLTKLEEQAKKNGHL